MDGVKELKLESLTPPKKVAKGRNKLSVQAGHQCHTSTVLRAAGTYPCAAAQRVQLHRGGGSNGRSLSSSAELDRVRLVTGLVLATRSFSLSSCCF